MAAIFLEIFFLILGITEISNAFSPSEDVDWYKRLVPHQYNHFERKNIRNRFGALCNNKHGYFTCNRLDIQIGKPRYPKFPNPYFRHNWPFELNKNSDENINTDSSYASSKNAISVKQPNNTIEGLAPEKQELFNYFRITSSDKSDSPTQSTAQFKFKLPSTPSTSVAVNFTPEVHVTDQNIPAFKISTESSEIPAETGTISNSDTSRKIHRNSLGLEYKSALKKESLGLIEGQSTFSTQMLENSSKGDKMVSPIENKETETPSEFVTDTFTEGERIDSTFFDKREERTDGSTFLNDGSVNSYSKVPEINGTRGYVFSSAKTSSSRETLLPNKENFEKKSTVFRSTTSVLTKEATPSDGKSISPVGVQSTNNQDTELVSIVSQNYAFSTTDKVVSSSFETKSTVAGTLENESTTKNSTSSSKISLVPLTDTVPEDSIKEIVFTKSSSSENEITPAAITQDHVIEISSIRTARIVITSVFLVIVLTAVTVLAVYIFRIKRKVVHYDQLLLIP